MSAEKTLFMFFLFTLPLWLFLAAVAVFVAAWLVDPVLVWWRNK